MLSTTAIQLSGREYLLARDEKFHGRRWTTRVIPEPVHRERRPDVVPGDVDGTYIIRMTDWSGGLGGDYDNIPNTIYLADAVHGLKPGVIRPAGRRTRVGSTVALDFSEMFRQPAGVVTVFGDTFVISGRNVYRLSASGLSVDRDFGAGNVGTSFTIHNSLLVVSVVNGSGVAQAIQTRNSAGTWATGANTATLVTRVEDRLWRAGSGGVSNIGPADNPVSATFSADIQVGSVSTGITGLSAYGERLAVAKPEGLFLGDRAAIFPNVLPQFERVPHAVNGRGLATRGSDLLYPHQDGLLRYNNGLVEEIGLEALLSSAGGSDHFVGKRFAGPTAHRHHLWSAIHESGVPRANPWVRLTRDNLATFTNITTVSTDKDIATTTNLDAFSDVAPADYLLVGHTATYFGAMLLFSAPNSAAAVTAITIEYSTGAGTWANLNTTTTPVLFDTREADLSAPLGSTQPFFSKYSLIMWQSAPSDWVSATYDGQAAFWIRIGVTGTASTPFTLAEVEIITERPAPYILRGRSVKGQDRQDQSIIWEPFGFLGTSTIGALAPGPPGVTDGKYPYDYGPQLVIPSQNAVYVFSLPEFAIDGPVTLSAVANSLYGSVTTPRHNGGSNALKYFTRMRVTGRNIQAGRTVTPAYRLGDSTAWTSLSTYTTNSVSEVIGAQGRRIQLQLRFSNFTDNVYPEIHEVEIHFIEMAEYTNLYTAVLQLGGGAGLPRGGLLPDALIQLNNLEALVNSGSITLVDPLGRNRAVLVRSVHAIEVLQAEGQLPILYVEVTMLERRTTVQYSAASLGES